MRSTGEIPQPTTPAWAKGRLTSAQGPVQTNRPSHPPSFRLTSSSFMVLDAFYISRQKTHAVFTRSVSGVMMKIPWASTFSEIRWRDFHRVRPTWNPLTKRSTDTLILFVITEIRYKCNYRFTRLKMRYAYGRRIAAVDIAWTARGDNGALAAAVKRGLPRARRNTTPGQKRS